jgi:lysozyme family protein
MTAQAIVLLAALACGGGQEVPMFDQAHAFVQKWEGGAQLTLDPDDPGGATKYGISLRFLRNLPLQDADLNLDGEITWQDVAALDEEHARGIYRAYFWNRLRLDSMPPVLALALYDTAVNCGRPRAAVWLQAALGVRVDGIVGPATVAAVQAADPHEIIRDVLLARVKHYCHLAIRQEWGEKYIDGWLNRSADLVAAVVRVGSGA